MSAAERLFKEVLNRENQEALEAALDVLNRIMGYSVCSTEVTETKKGYYYNYMKCRSDYPTSVYLPAAGYREVADLLIRAGRKLKRIYDELLEVVKLYEEAYVKFYRLQESKEEEY